MLDKNVDKGFELYYWNLSYRRKFIRTLWVCLILFVLLILLRDLFLENTLRMVILYIVCPIASIVQAVYNYKKWKANS